MTTTISSLTPVESARASIAVLDAAASWAADATNAATLLEDQRAEIKAQAIRRLMGTTNELTQKLHSASSAETVVETDALYAAHRAKQRDAEVQRWAALAQWEAARRNAELDVALAAASAQSANTHREF